MAAVVEMLNVLEPVAAGADDVENFARAGFGIQRRRDGFVAQRAGERGDFLRRFAFLRERGQKIGLDRRRNFFVGQLLDGQTDLLVRRADAAAMSCWVSFSSTAGF